MVSFGEVIVAFAAVVLAYSLVRYLGATHNNLVDARGNVDRTWGNVEVLLQRRHDEVANLVDVASEHVETEQEVLAEVMVARERLVEAETPKQQAQADLVVRQAVEEVYQLPDDYPELRSHDHFTNLREKISRLEQRLEDRREYYNEAVARYNARLDCFPETVFASVQGYESREPFVADEAARDGVDVRERFGS